jgi:uncharacterized protein (TIGR02246 family)
MLVAPAAAAPAAAPFAAVNALLQRSAAQWNAGDLDAFMTNYEPSADTLSIDGSTIVRGVADIRARYVRRYGRHVSGKLAFTDLTVRALGPDYAFATGVFHLTMSDGKRPSGLFTLIVHRTAAGWRIIVDH